MSRYTSTSTTSTGTWVHYGDSSGTATASGRRYRVVGRHNHLKATPRFHCKSCNKRYDGKGKKHPDYPEVLICDKCIKERNKHLILVTDVEKI